MRQDEPQYRVAAATLAEQEQCAKDAERCYERNGGNDYQMFAYPINRYQSHFNDRIRKCLMLMESKVHALDNGSEQHYTRR